MAVGTGGRGGCPPYFANQKNKSLSKTAYKSVYCNKAKAQWILEITDILMHKIVSYLYVTVIQKSPPPPYQNRVLRPCSENGLSCNRSWRMKILE